MDLFALVFFGHIAHPMETGHQLQGQGQTTVTSAVLDSYLILGQDTGLVKVVLDHVEKVGILCRWNVLQDNQS